MRKGDSIGEFLRSVQQQLSPEFREVRTTSVENLLYVKEDLIIPHVRTDSKPISLVIVGQLELLILICYMKIKLCAVLVYVFIFLSLLQQHSFYELIVNKARGKSGPVMSNFSISVQFQSCLAHSWYTPHEKDNVVTDSQNLPRSV